MSDGVLGRIRRRLGLRSRLRRAVRRIAYFGWRFRCPVCGSRLRYLLPDVPHPNGICPVCRAHKRHRVAWLYMMRQTGLCDGNAKRVLHFAPEPELAQRLRAIKGVEYLSADSDPKKAMVKADLQQLQFPDGSFDIVLCSHVLEHVDDDRRAMRELRRILRTRGWALVQVPMWDKPTDEDPTITDPAERARRFWQPDHVRLYGPDIADRLQAAGFAVRVVQAGQFLTAEDLAVTATTADETLFICSKGQ